MLKIENLSVSVWEKKILNDINLEFELGQNYCVLGKNGSGKSSLAMTIMWHPKYEVESWRLKVENSRHSELVSKSFEGSEDVRDPELNSGWLDVIDLLQLDPSERAQLGIFLAFQAIPEVEWLKLFEFLRIIYSKKVGENITFLKFKDIVKWFMDDLDIDHNFLWRDLNVGFSGGERRKIEILQIKLLEPKYIFLDEVDSGLDVDAFRAFTILDYISVNKVFVMEKWSIVAEGGEDLAMKIKKDGFGG